MCEGVIVFLLVWRNNYRNLRVRFRTVLLTLNSIEPKLKCCQICVILIDGLYSIPIFLHILLLLDVVNVLISGINHKSELNTCIFIF